MVIPSIISLLSMHDLLPLPRKTESCSFFFLSFFLSFVLLRIMSAGSDSQLVTNTLPSPSSIEHLTMDELKSDLQPLLPAAVSNIVMAKSATATKARYTRIYAILTARVPGL